MRVVVLGAGGAHRTERSIIRALRALGHPCRWFDVPGWHRWLGSLAPKTVRRLAERFRPDALILTRHARHLGLETIRSLSAGRAGGLWYFDLEIKSGREITDLAEAAGALFLNCYTQVARYRAAGVSRVHYLPQAADPAVDRPAPSAPAAYHCDLSFVGSGHYPHRHDVLRRLAATGRLQIRGPSWEAAEGLPVIGGVVRGKAFAQVVRGAAISLGANALPEQDRECACASNRMWKVLACGGFFLGQWQLGTDQLAIHGEHCAWYRSDDHAVELASHYLAHPREREAIAETGRAHVLAHHTYVHRVELLLTDRGYPITTLQTIS